MFETCKKIRKLIEDALGDSIKEYFIDDPNLVPMSSLPCIAVAPISTEIDVADTSKDTFTYTIDVILIISAKEELEKFKKEMVGSRYLTDTMEGRDSSGNLKSTSILYVIRKNLRLGSNWYIENTASIDYGIRPRRTETGEQFYTKEASVRLSVVRIKNRPT